MENENVTTTPGNSPFMKYFKNIFIFITIIIFVVFLCILFIKVGSNVFFWETPKGNNNNSEPLTRTKRNIEDQIKDIKNNERFTIDLEFLEQMNSTDILENQIEQLKKELNILKNKDQNISKNDDTVTNLNSDFNKHNSTNENNYASLSMTKLESNLNKEEENKKDIPKLVISKTLENVQEDNKYKTLTSTEEHIYESIEESFKKRTSKIIENISDIDTTIPVSEDNKLKHNLDTISKEAILESNTMSLENISSNNSSDFEDFTLEDK